MKHILNFICLLILLSFNKSIAQGEAAVPFLYSNPSPQFSGLGWTGVSIPNNDAFGFHYNPAMLGYFGQNNNLSINSFLNPTKWFGIEQFTYKSTAFNLGYNFKNELNGVSLSIGSGYIHSRFISPNFFSINYGPIYDSYSSYGIGVSIDYYVTLALGVSFKRIHSDLSNYFSSIDPSKEVLDANAFDYGFLLILPIINLFDNTLRLNTNSNLIPEINYSFGYSRLNIGEEVYYRSSLRTDPLPLTARLGHTINLGCNYETEDLLINLIDYNLILEADDILLESEFINEKVVTSYQGMLGDIKFGRNLIQLKSNDGVVIHKGHSIKLLEIVTILRGSFNGERYYRKEKTDGLIVSSSGLFKWLGLITESDTFKYIANHIEFKYISSAIFKDKDRETDFSGLSVSFFGYSFN